MKFDTELAAAAKAAATKARIPETLTVSARFSTIAITGADARRSTDKNEAAHSATLSFSKFFWAPRQLLQKRTCIRCLDASKNQWEWACYYVWLWETAKWLWDSFGGANMVAQQRRNGTDGKDQIRQQHGSPMFTVLLVVLLLCKQYFPPTLPQALTCPA